MKKLYRKSAVHPTPSVVSEHLLSFLPAAILALTAALSPADREVLAYLISCSSVSFSGSQRRTAAQKTAPVGGGLKVGGGGGGGGDDHAACFNCNCFRCYMSYWAKWDSSPNRQLIHEVIDAFEENLLKESRKEKNKKERRKGKNVKVGALSEQKNSEASLTAAVDFGFSESNAAAERGGDCGRDCGGGRREEEEEEEDDDSAEEEFEKGSMRRFVSFLGERIWSVWG